MKVHNNQVIELLTSTTFVEWVGVLGYNNLPYFKNTAGEWQFAPVSSIEVGFADGRQSYVDNVDIDTINTFINSFPIGKELFVPDYSGCHHDGTYIYIKKDVNQWQCHYESAR